jgi:hypothetical protein
MAEIVTFERVFWGPRGFPQSCSLCGTLLQQELPDRPLFLAYIIISLVPSPLLSAIYRFWGFGSPVALNLAWGTPGLIIAARSLAVAQICRRVLGVYRGIWALAWRTLLAIAGFMVLYSFAVARSRWQAANLNFDRGLELAISGVIVTVFLFAQHYEIDVRPMDHFLAIGFLFFSSFFVLNNTLLEGWLGSYETLWNLLGTLAFMASLLLWIWAVRETQEERRWQPEMLPSSADRTLAPQINLRLRALDEQLGKLLYAEAKKH